MATSLDFHALFEASPNPYMVLDRELRFVAANAAYLAATTRRREELLGRRVTDVFPHDPADPNNESRRLLLASLSRVLATGKPDVLPSIVYRIVVRGPDGEREETHVWSATHTPILDESNQIAFILQHTVNVTALPDAHHPAARSEAAGVLARAAIVSERNDELQRMNAWLRTTFAQAPVAITVLSGPSYVIELANARVCEIWARPEEAILGRPLFDALPEIRRQGLEELLAGVRITGAPFVGNELPVHIARGPAGELVETWFDFVYQPIAGPRGEIDAILVVASEVTETVRARRRSEAAQAELEAIFESVPEPLYAGDAGGIQRANAAARALLGYTSDEPASWEISALIADLEPRRADSGARIAPSDAPFARALRGESTRVEAIIRQHGTGRERRLVSSGAPIRSGGKVIGAVVTHIDTTERFLAEAEARRLARVLDATPDFVGIAELDERPVFVNRAGLELVGLASLSEAAAVPVSAYFVERDRARVRDEVIPAALRDGFWQGELAFVHHRTGEEIPVLYSLFPLRDGDKVTALATITRDLRAHKAAERERAQLFEDERTARALAEQANAVKDQFLATVSHELRTPLTAIVGWAEMMRLGKPTPEKQARAFEIIERNARIQAHLIDDLLDVSRILAGKLEVDLADVDVAGVVGAAIETVRPTAEGKGVALEVDAESSAVVRGDAGRLQQVVWNLLVNAVKFTPKGGRVVLRLACSADRVEIAVTDSGTGIDAAFLPHVFERFRQAPRGAGGSGPGLGLGLSIVKHVVEAHGGEVTAHSDGLGTGATFRVRLPLRPSPPAIAGEPCAAWHPPVALAGMSVLVIDDEADTREYVRALLEQGDARVTVATSAAEGLARLAELRPDLVLSDIEMPGEDGYAFVRKMRASRDAGIARTPAIALTAYARAEDRTRAMGAGFQNHIAKPIDRGELLAVVAAFAPRARADARA